MHCCKHNDSEADLDVIQIEVSKCLRKELLRVSHDIPMAAHLGINKMTARLKRFFWWPSMSKDIHYYCKTCQFLAKTPKPKKAPLINLPIRNTAFEYLCCDIVGHLPECHITGNRFIFSVIDLCTRYPIAIVLQRHTAEDIANALLSIFCLFGVCKQIQSDNGSDVSSDLWREVMEIFKIKHSFSTIFHPETQGTFERFHRTLYPLTAVSRGSR